ncbi:MAG: type II toxin-antitoxin system PemK/MazF family toxin [Bryobacteraceae bacterium]|nr:type II toxin-antitoxin system PemK/MazF family toxin [Bryobacteraceae bacterium]
MICDLGDVVIANFPFAEQMYGKWRPAVVLSSTEFNACGRTVVAMVTSSRAESWPGDLDLVDVEPTGLRPASFIRLKLFTIDNVAIGDRIGALSPADRANLSANLKRYVPLTA